MAKLSFWGGVGTVTGSKFMLESKGVRVLVDCGMFQGLKELRERNWQDPPFDPASIDAVLITHAHIDHTGYLPRLVRQGFKGPVFCSHGTNDLLKILLPDAARIQEEDAAYRNRHQLTRHAPALPLYDEDDARAALELVKPVPNDGQLRPVARGFSAGFSIAGHILGSSLVLVNIDAAGDDSSGRKILFSGDLGHYDQAIIRDPVSPPNCDYLLVESTYGDRLHDPVDPSDELAKIINEAARRDAPLLIPAFAVGRTQEVVYAIRELEDAGKIPVLPVRVDSPMAAAATQAYIRRKEEHDEEYASILAQGKHPLKTHSMLIATSRDDSKRLNDESGARIIISASGMMTGGRVMHHARKILPDPKAIVLFVGYQAAGTTGRRIIDGEKDVKILGEWVPVRCTVEQVGGFSAHADWNEVLRWLRGLAVPPKMTFLTHGEPKASIAMAGHISDGLNWPVTLPSYGETVDLR